jgi:hypothetical protein
MEKSSNCESVCDTTKKVIGPGAQTSHPGDAGPVRQLAWWQGLTGRFFLPICYEEIQVLIPPSG